LTTATESGLQNVKLPAASGTNHHANDCRLEVTQDSLLHNLFPTVAQPNSTTTGTVFVAHRPVAAALLRAAKVDDSVN